MNQHEALSALVSQIDGMTHLLGSSEAPMPVEAVHGLARMLDTITAPARKALAEV